MVKCSEAAAVLHTDVGSADHSSFVKFGYLNIFFCVHLAAKSTAEALRCLASFPTQTAAGSSLLGQTLFQSCHSIQTGPLCAMVGQDHIPALLTGSGQLHQHGLESCDKFKIHRGGNNAGQQLREPLQPVRLENGVGQPGEKGDAASQGLHSQEPELTDVIPGTHVAG